PLPTPTPLPFGTGPLHAEGGSLVDAGGRPVRLTGVNWSGMETGGFAPIGLNARNLDAMLDQIAASGFNTVRLPFSNELLDSTVKRFNVNFAVNPKLIGLSGLELLDHVIEAAGRHGLRIILDRHRPGAAGQCHLWYTAEVPVVGLVRDWVMLAQRYHVNRAVIRARPRTRPHRRARLA